MEPNTLGVKSNDPYYRYTGETVVSSCFNLTTSGVCHHDDLCKEHRHKEKNECDQEIVCMKGKTKKRKQERKNKKRKSEHVDGFTILEPGDLKNNSEIITVNTESDDKNGAITGNSEDALRSSVPTVKRVSTEKIRDIEQTSKRVPEVRAQFEPISVESECSKLGSPLKAQEDSCKEKDKPLLTRKPLPACPPLSLQPPPPPTLKSESVSAPQSPFPLTFFVLILIWSAHAGFKCDNSVGFSNQFLNESPAYMYAGNATSVGMDLRGGNDWRYITGSINIRSSVCTDGMWRRTMCDGKAKAKLQIMLIYEAANSDIIPIRQYAPVSCFSSLQAQNVMSNADPQADLMDLLMDLEAVLMDLEAVLMDSLINIRAVVMNTLAIIRQVVVDPLINLLAERLRGNRQMDTRLFRFPETTLHTNGIMKNNRTENTEDLSNTTVDDGVGTTIFAAILIGGLVGNTKMATSNYPHKVNTDFKVARLNISALDEEQHCDLDYEMKTSLCCIGRYTADNNLFDAPDKGLLWTARSKNIQIYNTAADRWKTIIPHLMEYLRVFVYTHTGYSVVRKEASIRVVRIPRAGTSAYFLVLGVAAGFLGSAVSTFGMWKVSCWFSILQALLLLSGDVEENPGPVTVEDLVAAVRNGDLATVQRLCKSANKSTLLSLLKRSEDNSCALKALLDTRTGENEETVLHVAAEIGDLQILAYLCENGADIHARDKYNNTVLHIAVWNDKLDCVEYLCTHGADKNSRGADKLTPLHTAAGKGYLDCLRYLCEQGADIDARNENNNTALHLAAGMGKLDCVVYLCTQGADKDSKGEDECTPLHYAAQYSYLECVQYLYEEAGADINSTDKDGDTSIHIAVTKNHIVREN